MAEFTEWPKTARLFRDIVISEKIDGTNAAIHVEGSIVTAQSRKRLITPESDNFGFARWVHTNADELVATLGEGVHFGEWWGVGIQRGYNLQSRRFSLFNTAKWKDLSVTIGDVPVGSVPVLYEGTFSEGMISIVLHDLEEYGSRANLGYLNPEGICVFHTQTRGVFKVTLDNEDKGKWETN